MLKLIIVDDERVIRETISNLIDWKRIGIELIGSCKDGIEAYDMILDENPDIVMTDIRMPGLSGLELVERISQTSLNTQFIILSGFGEFEYAKQAMKYGIRHYLLKPCNEEQIIDSMKDVIRDCYHQLAFQSIQDQQKQMAENLHHTIIGTIINEGVSLQRSDPGLFKPYVRFLDFDSIGYELYYIYYLEEKNLTECLHLLMDYHEDNAPSIPMYSVYVKNTLLVFFQNYQVEYTELNTFINDMTFMNQSVNIECKHESYDCLGQLLEVILQKLQRYGIIYYMNGLRPIPTCNYNHLIQEMNRLADDCLSADARLRADRLNQLNSMLGDVSNPDFLKQLAGSLIIRLSSQGSTISPIDVTEFLLGFNELTDIHEMRSMAGHMAGQMVARLSEQPERYSDFVEKTVDYVKEHLANPNLTLKWIAENYLFMNVDYVSKCFIKETKQKFSNFLTDLRIQKAKALLTDCDGSGIHQVAEQVGCGNNPQYFSQIFKKHTGMTPSAYAKMMKEGVPE